ncbi:hypothetical protein [Helicobacter labacensis]|uniref:hypothetical protein n=1 Tax=Helicobacter labacensis TaxID=2316079 RepID=UPI0019699475|nr:hypothetical protein [Helicobacter labacensis]
MIRLLFICLVVATLHSKALSPKPPSLLQAISKIQNLAVKIDRRCQDPNEGIYRCDYFYQFAPTLEKLGMAFVNQIPLLQALKPHNKTEARLIDQIKEIEMLHLYLLIYGSISQKIPPSQVLQDFLAILKFSYAPLIEAHQQGLDLNAYAKALATTPISLSKVVNDDMQIHIYDYYEKGIWDKHDKEKTPIPKIVQNYELAAHACILTEEDCWEEVIGYAQWDFAFNLVVWKFEAPVGLDINKVYPFAYDHLVRRIYSFFYHLMDYFPKIKDYPSCPTYNPRPPLELEASSLKKRPSLCLAPQYLSPKTQQTCLRLFEENTYDTDALKSYIQDLRLINIDDKPCFFLDAQDKIQTFKSKNALCVALQRIKFLW